MAPDTETQLIEALAFIKTGFQGTGGGACPFYSDLADLFIEDVRRKGPVFHALAPYADEGPDRVYVLRMLGALHRMALAGESPELSAHFPSTGGDADAAATYTVIEALLADPPPQVQHMFDRPPQTNEVGRSIALMTGLLVIADQLRMPLRLREIGASAGLNLRLDQYWYEHDGKGVGDPDSKVRFVDLWEGGTPPWDAPLEIADRRGCDRDPIDAIDPEGALTLLSYVWPQPATRFELAKAAIEQAADMPVEIDKEDIATWLPSQLEDQQPGTAMVVMHSVVWQHLTDEVRESITEVMESAGAAATAESPLVWLSLEPNPETFFPGELCVRFHSGSRESDALLGETGFHGGPLRARFTAAR